MTAYVYNAPDYQLGWTRQIATLITVAKDEAVLTVNGDELARKVIQSLPSVLEPGQLFFATVLIPHPCEVQVWKVSLFTRFPDSSLEAFKDHITNVLGINPTKLVPEKQ